MKDGAGEQRAVRLARHRLIPSPCLSAQYRELRCLDGRLCPFTLAGSQGVTGILCYLDVLTF